MQQRLAIQRNYLRNPLPSVPGVCAICRSEAAIGEPRCRNCEQHRRLSGGRVADAVVPIAYAVRGRQHAHNLVRYKETPPARLAAFDLTVLLVDFMRRHYSCLASIGAAPFSDLATVPSTKQRDGEHPLVRLASTAVRLPMIEMTANGRYRSNDRTFHADRFEVGQVRPGARVLLLDDTWTTGGRLQSLACALKSAGAASVVAVVLGRWVNPGWSPSRPILNAIRRRPFEPGRCTCDDL